MPKTAIKIGPADQGRRMSLVDFDHAEAQEGYLCELSRGVITVSDVPSRRHLLQVDSIREQLSAYRSSHPGLIATIAGSGECKLLIGKYESERHPDVTVYKTSPADEEDIWSTWIPEIVIEVVSPGSEERDYLDKRQEYFDFGVMEYWIVDADKQEVLVLRRRGGRWVERIVKPPEVYQSRQLPGFEFSGAAVFAAAAAAGK